jgi:hypothetical protein
MKHTFRNLEKIKKHGAALVLLGSLSIPQFAHASLINTDFSAGFSNWTAEIIDLNLGPQFIDPSLYPDNFTASTNSVSLNTSTDGQNDIWSIVLFQDVIFSQMGSGALTLSLDVTTDLTSNDYYFVQLRNLISNDVMDLSNGGSFDISAWIGVDATFEMGVQDLDFALPDYLVVSNINISSTDIPEPASWLLFLLGICGLRQRVRNKAN